MNSFRADAAALGRRASEVQASFAGLPCTPSGAVLRALGRLIQAGGGGRMGRTLIGIGLLIAAAGVIWLLLERIPGWRPGHLPGDIRIEKGNFRFYFPLATSIVISIVLTFVFWLLSRRSG